MRRFCELYLTNLNDAFSWRCRCAIQEAIIKGVPLGEAQPLWEVWKILLVALKNDGVIVPLASFMTYRKRRRETTQ